VYRKDVLAFAYACCKANGGAAGVDNQTFEDIETYGEERWLDELAQELKSRLPSSTSKESEAERRAWFIPIPQSTSRRDNSSRLMAQISSKI